MVYDVSKFLDTHPGGRSVLLMAAGRDITPLFDCYHPFTDKPKRFLEKFYVGELTSHSLPTFKEEGLFYKALRTKVEKYFKDTKQDPKFSWWMCFRFVVFPAILILSWIAQVYIFPQKFFLGCLFAALLGWFSALVTMANIHDGSHFAFTRSPLVWKILGLCHDFFNGCSLVCWTYQHIYGHHPYTNIDGIDPDIHTNTPDIRRIKWTQKWIPYYLYQHIFIPPLYFVLSMKTRLQDVFLMFVFKRNDTTTYNDIPLTDQLISIAGKTFFVIFRVVIPWNVLSPETAIIYFIIADVVQSYYMAFILQIAHLVDQVDWPCPDKDGKINEEWAKLQVESTVDFATDSWFWNTFTGGLNHQTTHHLFPGVSQYYYPVISRMVRESCKEFGVRYNHIPTVTRAVVEHVGYLKHLGQKGA